MDHNFSNRDLSLAAMENCLKTLEQYRACAQRVRLSFGDWQTASLAAAESESTGKRRRAARSEIEWWMTRKIKEGCSVQEETVDACLFQHSDELTAAAVAFHTKCDRCPCRYCAEPNPACTAQESWDCCEAYVVYRATYNACWKKLREQAASA